MDGVEVEIEVDASKTLELLVKMSVRMSSYRPVFEILRTNLERLNATHFATSGGVVGTAVGGGASGPWAAYGNWGGRLGQPARLVRTGNLLESLTNLRGAPNDVNNKSARFGTNVEYAKFHQYGTTKMPKRPVVFEPQGFAEDAAGMLGYYITGDASVKSLRKLFG